MALMTAQNVVKDVEVRIVKEGKPDQRQVYDVIDKDGVKWTAWEKELAEAAWNLKDQVSHWKVTVDQNGQYTNRTLKEIQPAGEQTMTEALGGSSFGHSGTSANATTSFSETKVSTFNPAPEGTAATPKDEMIWRQTAAKVSAAISTNPSEFWANLDDLVAYFATGKKAGVAPPAGVSFGDLTAPQTDDDIPF